MTPSRLAPLLLALPLFISAAPTQAGIEKRSEVREFIDEMVSKHGLSRRWLEGVFAHTQIQQSIIDAMNRPAEKTLTWARYRDIFIQPKRIEAGVQFWNEHAELLAQIEKEYQVPAEIIVGIIGVETFFGRNVGSYKVADALSTLTFAYPKRAPFFRGQLEEFLLICRKDKLNPREPVGSYAGAMGLPQFIPTSLTSFAIDHDGDGQRDLWNNHGDVFASVANYFRAHGWQWGGPVARRADLTQPPSQRLLDAGYKPHTPFGQLAAVGISPREYLDPKEPVALIALEGKEGDEHWIVANNFYVITRYNHSPLYAMAVYQLSEAIRSARAQHQKP